MLFKTPITSLSRPLSITAPVTARFRGAVLFRPLALETVGCDRINITRIGLRPFNCLTMTPCLVCRGSLQSSKYSGKLRSPATCIPSLSGLEIKRRKKKRNSKARNQANKQANKTDQKKSSKNMAFAPKTDRSGRSSASGTNKSESLSFLEPPFAQSKPRPHL